MKIRLLTAIVFITLSSCNRCEECTTTTTTTEHNSGGWGGRSQTTTKSQTTFEACGSDRKDVDGKTTTTTSNVNGNEIVVTTHTTCK